MEMGAWGELQRVGKRGNSYLYRMDEIEAVAAKRREQRERLAERKRKWRVRA